MELAALGTLTIPTGNGENLLGFDDPTFTPWFVASATAGRVSPRVNLGYSLRDGKDVSQARWVVGADVRTFDWLTLSGDFLGYHEDKRNGLNDDVMQAAVGFKINVIGRIALAGAFQFPLNRDGLRADIIYTTHLEYVL